jgi:excisionase family DNA binding protein
MTVAAKSVEIGRRLPSDSEREAANQLRRLIASNVSGDTTLHVLDEDKRPADVTLTPGLSNLLMDLLRYIGRGDAVTLVPVGKMLTTQQAADILNVSRPHLVSLLDQGHIEFSMVGRHRRIKAETLFDYKKKRDAIRSDALAELAAVDGEYL